MKTILMILLMPLIIATLTYAITDGCGDEVDINTACVIRTPPITCSTFDLYNSSNELIADDAPMEEIVADSGVYNFTFLPNASGIHTIVLCDNTSTQINVETTDETDLGTILSNQVTLQNNIETVNQTVKDVNVSILKNLTIQHGLTLTLIGDINASIIRNLSNDDGFFIPLFQEINSSILSNFSLSTLTSSVSTTDQIAIGEECAIQTLRQNLTIKYYYNRSSFSLANVTFNYTGVGIFINESYNYDNESYLSNVTRADHLG